ncbi:28S ribosomal protein S24-A, mitochondrial-like [Hydractinia symbiolongicarpus]|uniref:28S ribosomal protein S24-A, mitochondrial-like n=1 Tax=Hydractinia symbiolongicarpus TaxID=13093 RepID=UPI002549EBA1|nr:28S ribosomal protein S24-A, mitochondrial-like [Hydractinia symbiolongicarpus]
MLKSNSRILNRINLKSAGCLCSMRNIMKKPVTKLPNQSTKGTKMKRYEVPPHRIGVLKSWDSRHTGGLKGSYWAAERFADDIMITKLIEGTFYDRITSDVIIKRRLNEIVICFFVTGRGQEGTTAKVYFLKAFTEKLLSEMMGCIVKIELRTGPEFV